MIQVYVVNYENYCYYLPSNCSVIKMQVSDLPWSWLDFVIIIIIILIVLGQSTKTMAHHETTQTGAHT